MATLLLWPHAGLEAQDSEAQDAEAPGAAEAASISEPSPGEPSEQEQVGLEPAEPREYVEAIDAAVAMHAQGRFEEARELLRRAHSLVPSARTLRGLGKVEFELRNYPEAFRLFEQALRSSTRPLDARLRAEVEELLEQVRTYLGGVSVELSPASALVLVDGDPVAQGPRSELLLAAGEHQLEFQADNHASERRTVKVKGGEQRVLRVALTPRREVLAPSLEGATAQRDSLPLRKRWWVWTLTAAALGGTATALALAYRADGATGARVDGGSSGAVLVSP